MKRYVYDDQAVEAEGPADLVQIMREMSFTATSSCETYMVATAARVGEQVGADIRSDTPENFIADLQKVGLVEEQGK